MDIKYVDMYVDFNHLHSCHYHFLPFALPIYSIKRHPFARKKHPHKSHAFLFPFFLYVVVTYRIIPKSLTIKVNLVSICYVHSTPSLHYKHLDKKKS